MVSFFSLLPKLADADYRVAVIGDRCADMDSVLHDCLIQRFFPTRGLVFSSERFIVTSSRTVSSERIAVQSQLQDATHSEGKVSGAQLRQIRENPRHRSLST